MKKLYPVIVLLGCLLCWNVGFGQCDYSLKIQSSNTQINCYNSGSVLTATSSAPADEIFYIWKKYTSNGDVEINEAESSITVYDSGIYILEGIWEYPDNTCFKSDTIQITKDLTPPVVTFQSYPTTVSLCNGDSIVFTASGADTYQWKVSGTPETSVSDSTFAYSTNYSTYNPGPTNVIFVSGTNTSNGCSSIPATVAAVLSLPKPYKILISGPDTICSGSPITLATIVDTTTNPPYWQQIDLFQWTQPYSQSGPTFTDTPVNTTDQPIYLTYIVKGTNGPSGCSVSDTSVVTINPKPTITVQGISAVCSGSSATLTASGAETYLWNQDSTDPTITVAPTETTEYFVTGTDTNGCTGTDSFTLFVNPVPTGSISIINQSSCQYNTINPPQVIFIGTNGKRPYTFQYTENGYPLQAVTKDENDTVVIPVPADESHLYYTYYRLTSVTDSNGCKDSIQDDPQAEVISYILPTPLLTSKTDTSICSGSHFTYTATSSTPGLNVFYWTRPDVTGISATGPNNSGGANANISDTLVNTTSQPITVDYIFRLTTDFCSTTYTIKVTVNPLPAVAISGPAVLCSGSTATLTASGAETYLWSQGSTDPTITVAPTETTYYSVTGTDANGCTNTGFDTLVVDLPFASVNATRSSVCQNDTQPEVIFTGSGQSPFTFFYHDNYGAKSISTSAGEDGVSIGVPTDQPGTFTYTLDYVIDSYCIHTIPLQEANVVILPTPDVRIEASRSAVCDGDTITLTASGADAYQWQPVSSTDVTIIPRLSSSGLASFIVTGTDANGCTNTDTSGIVVNSVPDASINTPYSEICQKDSVATPPVVIFTGSKGKSPYTFEYIRSGIINEFLSITTDASSDTTITKVPTKYGSVLYNYTLSSVSDNNGCRSEIDNQRVEVLINRSPYIENKQDTTINSGSTFIYTPAVVSDDSHFVWTRLDTVGLSATGSSSGEDNTINNTLINNTSQPLVVRYVFALSVDGPCDRTDTIRVTVNPVLYLTSAKDTAVCSGTPLTYDANSSLPRTQFRWIREDVNGISATGPSSGDSTINNILTNNTSAPLPVNYIFTLSSGTYITTETVQVTVNPLPSLSSRRDTSVCSGSIFTYTATSLTGTNFNWTRPIVTGVSSVIRGNGNGYTVTDLLTNTTLQPVPVNYFFTITAGEACLGTDVLTVTVNPVPSLVSTKDTIICSGSPFIYTAKGNLLSTIFSWSRRDVTGISAIGSSSGDNIINNTLTNSTPLPVKVTYIFTLNDSCSSTDSIIVTVNPAPLLTSKKDTAICSGVPFNYTANSSAKEPYYSWTRPAVEHISATALNIGSGATLNDVLTTDTTQPVTVKYIYTLSVGNGCNETDSLQVMVKPAPYLVSTKDTSACSKLPFTYTAKSSIPRTLFSWTRDSVFNILPARGNGSDSTINETLINNSSQPIKVDYVFTFALNGGCLKTETVQVTVNPAPALTSKTKDTACSGVPYFYTAVSLPGTSFSWLRPAVDGISNPAGSSPTPTINEKLINTTTDPVEVTYIFTLTLSGGCTSIGTVQVTVNPLPRFISKDKDTTCSSSLFTYIAKSSVLGTKFSWTRMSVSYISPATGNGSDSIISETLTNTALYPVKVTYTFTLQAGQNCTQTGTLDVVVNPTPKLVSSKTTITTCSTQPFSYVAKSSISSANDMLTTFSWTRRPVKGILPESGNGITADTIRESLINTETDSITVTYLITLTTKDGCSSVDSINVTVLPAPVLSAGSTVSDTVFCNGFFVDQGLHFSSSIQGASVMWTSDPSDAKAVGFSDAEGGSNIAPFTAINTGSVPLIAKVIVTVAVPVAGEVGCKEANFPFTVTVNPTPKVTEISQAAFCNGDTVSNGIQFISVTSQKDSVWWKSDTNIGFGTADSSGNIPPFVAEGNSNTSLNATITVHVTDTSSYTYCADTTTFNLVVNPVPVLKSASAVTICSGSPLAYLAQSSVAGTEFIWKRKAVSGILPSSDSRGTTESIINETLTNQDTVPIAVTYLLTLKSNCSKDTTLTVTVNPAPRISPVAGFTYSADTSFGNSPLYLCNSAENINFNVISPQSYLNGISYTWHADNPNADIKNKNYPNTVITFNAPGEYKISVDALYGNPACVSSSWQMVTVKSEKIDISRQKIFLKQPGNMLVYPDNSFTRFEHSVAGYQWGYDSVYQPLPALATSKPIDVPGQIYQFYVPDSASCRCIKKGGSLDTDNFFYWVLLKDEKGCSTKLYYNGPFDDAPDSVRLPPPVSAVQVQVIPNPNSGVFNVSVKGNMYGNIEAQVYNSAGQLVFRKKFVKTTIEATEKFIAGGLPTGVYFLVLRSSDFKEAHSRFIISH